MTQAFYLISFTFLFTFSNLLFSQETHTSSPIFQGFNMTWSERPHRVSDLDFGVIKSHDNYFQTCNYLGGGSWAQGSALMYDYTANKVNYQWLNEGQGLHVHHYQTDTLSVSGKIHDNKLTESTYKRFTITLPSSISQELAGKENYVALQGLETTKFVPEVGYTLNEIKLSTTNLRKENGSYVFDVEFKIDAGTVPDRIQKVKEFMVDFRVRVALISGQDLTPQKVVLNDNKRQHGGLFLHGDAHTSDYKTSVPLAFYNSSKTPFMINQSFHLKIGNLKPYNKRWQGRYIRFMRNQINEAYINHERKELELSYDLGISNAGEWTRASKVHAHSDWLILYVPKANAGDIQHFEEPVSDSPKCFSLN